MITVHDFWPEMLINTFFQRMQGMQNNFARLNKHDTAMTSLQRCKKGVWRSEKFHIKVPVASSVEGGTQRFSEYYSIEHKHFFFWPLLISMPNEILTSTQVKMGNWAGDRRGGWWRWNALMQPQERDPQTRNVHTRWPPAQENAETLLQCMKMAIT